MSYELNTILYDELCEVHETFQNTIAEMQQQGIIYQYDEIIKEEDNSYNDAYNLLHRLDSIVSQHNYLCFQNKEVFADEKKIYMKFLLIYLISIFIIRTFCKSITAEKMKVIWESLLIMACGGINAGLVFRSIKKHRNNEEVSKLFNSLNSLKEEYDSKYDLAAKEVNNISSLLRKLNQEIKPSKIFIKNKKTA